MQVESDIERYVIGYARYRDVLVLKLNVQGQRGWPDTLMLYHGKLLFLEFKKPGEKPRRLQTYIMFEIAGHGFPALWVDSKEEGVAAVDQLLKGTLT